MNNKCIAIQNNNEICKININIQEVKYKDRTIYLCKRHINVLKKNINNLKITDDDSLDNLNNNMNNLILDNDEDNIINELENLSLKDKNKKKRLLIDKYKPNNLTDFCGNKDNVRNITKWLLKWNLNIKYKCILLSGSSGIGKSLCINLICKLLKYDIIDVFGKDLIELIKKFDFKHKSLNKKKKVLIIDEIDNYDNNIIDKLLKLNIIKITKYPIIFICNNKYTNQMKKIKNICYNIEFKLPFVNEILLFIRNICIEENIKISDKKLTELIKYKRNDIRAILNDLYFYEDNINKNIIVKESNNIFDVYKKLINNKSILTSEYNSDTCNTINLMIYENYLNINKNINENEKLEIINKVSELLIDYDIINSNEIDIFYKNTLGVDIPSYYLKNKIVTSDFPKTYFKLENERKRKYNELEEEYNEYIKNKKTNILFSEFIEIKNFELL